MATDQFGLTDGDYVPDPGQETALLVEGFFGHIAATLREHSLPDNLLAAMRTRHVHRCFYHHVLVANSAPELTPLLCAFDGNWIEALEPDRDGFRFERTTTIGLGGNHCPFHFTRTGAREPGTD